MAQIIIEEGKEKRALTALLDEVLKNRPINTDVTFLVCSGENISDLNGACAVAHPSNIAVQTQAKTVSYSVSNTLADLVAINKQLHDNNISFELMTENEMGRVFIRNKSNYTMEQVLMCAAALFAGGAPLMQIIEAMNAVLK